MDHSTDVLPCEEGKVIWEDARSDPAIEPHSTTNAEDELATYREAFSSGDSELEFLLHQFNNFFTSRFDQEMSQFQANLSGLMFEQQDHVRRIVKAVTEDGHQVVTDIPVDEVMHGQTIDPLGSESEPMVTNQNASKYSDSVRDDRELMKKQRLLELTTLACSVSSMLAKPKFRK